MLFYMNVKQMSVTTVSLTSSVSLNLKSQRLFLSCFPSMGEAPECPCMQMFALSNLDKRSGVLFGPNLLAHNEKTR